MGTVNPPFKPTEVKREEFRKYLEKNGVMDAFTRVLVNLYEEVDKPDDALEYVRDKLSAMAGLESGKQLQVKLGVAQERIEELEAQIKGAPDVTPDGSNTEPPSSDGPTKEEDGSLGAKAEKSEEP